MSTTRIVVFSYDHLGKVCEHAVATDQSIKAMQSSLIVAARNAYLNKEHSYTFSGHSFPLDCSVDLCPGNHFGYSARDNESELLKYFCGYLGDAPNVFYVPKGSEGDFFEKVTINLPTWDVVEDDAVCETRYIISYEEDDGRGGSELIQVGFVSTDSKSDVEKTVFSAMRAAFDPAISDYKPQTYKAYGFKIPLRLYAFNERGLARAFSAVADGRNAGRNPIERALQKALAGDPRYFLDEEKQTLFSVDLPMVETIEEFFERISKVPSW